MIKDRIDLPDGHPCETKFQDALTKQLVTVVGSIVLLWIFKRLFGFFKPSTLLDAWNSKGPNLSSLLNYFFVVRSMYRQSTDDVPALCIFLQNLLGFCKLFESQRMIRFHLGWDSWLICFTPETAKVVLSRTTAIGKSNAYQFTKSWLGDGLILSSGNKWRYRRKLLTPAFHFSILPDYMPIFNKHSSILVSRLRNLSKEPFFDATPLLSRIALDIISETTMGVPLELCGSDIDQYVESIHSIQELVIYRGIRPWLHPDAIFYLTSAGRDHSRHVRTVHDLTKKIIKEKKKLMENSRNLQSKRELKINEIAEKKKPSFLEILLEVHLSDSTITEEDILDEVNVFMFAGSHSISTSLSWILYYLGLYEDAQNKAQVEVDGIFQGDNDRAVTYEDILRMKYVDCIIKESLRLQPTFPIIAREADEDFKVFDSTIHKGTKCIIFPLVVHQDKESFPNPEQFLPERFLPENTSRMQPYSYIPFAAGPRNCIGQKFAMLELKTIVINILRRFCIKSLDPRDKVNTKFVFVAMNAKPFRLRFTPRESVRNF